MGEPAGAWAVVWRLPEFMGPFWAESSGGSVILDIRQIGKFVIFTVAVAIIYRTWTTRQRGSYGRV